jgi:outer membrane immunogenic protein
MNKKIIQKSVAFLALGIIFLAVPNANRVFSQTNLFDSLISEKSEYTPPATSASTTENEGSTVLPTPTPTPRPVTKSNWTGFYAGGFIGGNFGKATADTSTVFNSSGYFTPTSIPPITTTGRQELSPSGFNGGLQAGYNYQTGHLVVGAEADIGAETGSSSSTSSGFYVCCSGTGFTITQSVKTKWILTARPRAGYAISKGFFIYATGGLAAAHINYRSTFTDNFAAATENGGTSSFRLGWAGGGGAEYRLGRRWSAKGEFLRVDLGRTTTTSTNLMAFTPPIAFPINPFTNSIYLRQNMVRFAINYHF